MKIIVTKLRPDVGMRQLKQEGRSNRSVIPQFAVGLGPVDL